MSRKAMRQDSFEISDPSAFPSLPSNRTERLRKSLAQKGKDDLYFFIRGILGYEHVNPRTHGALIMFLQECDAKRRMIQMPRSHYKTTLATISHSIWLVVHNPDIRILLVASSSQNAERFLEEIKNHFQHNPKFRWLYPELIPEDFNKITWNKQQMTVNRDAIWREPTIDTIGSRGAAASRHYNVIKADDIIGEKEYQSDSEMDKTIEWASGLESLLVSPIEDSIDFIGTRWRMDDVYAWAEEFYGLRYEERPIGPHAYQKGELAVFRREAMEEGKPIFPEKFSKRFFVRLQTQRPERYAAQYANNPRAAGVSSFREEWLRFMKWTYIGDKRAIVKHKPEGEKEVISLGQMDRIALIDPAVGESKRNRSRPAMLATGKYGSDVHIFDTYIGMHTPDELVEKIFEWDAKYDMRFFSIEKYGYQGSLKYWLIEKAEREGLPYPSILEWPPQGVPAANKAKEERIKGLQPLFRAGQIWVFEGMTEFLDEYLFYPRGKYKDSLDALAQGVVLWGNTWDQEHSEEMARIHDEIVASIGPTGYSLNKESVFAERIRRREEDRWDRWEVGGSGLETRMRSR